MDSVRSKCREAWPGLSASSPSENGLKDNYVVLRDIGKGGFGQVSLARHVLTGSLVAVKALPGLRDRPSIWREITTMKAVEHLNIVQLFEIQATGNFTYLVMEHVSGGRLTDYVRRSGGLEEEEARRLFRQVVSAVCYLHTRGILHRDLKPQNILLDSQRNAKVIDFGLSYPLRPGQKLLHICGTPAYCAPEVYEYRGYDQQADLWSLGAILYFMFAGRAPFTGSSREELLEKEQLGMYQLPAHIPRQPRFLILRLLIAKPQLRATMDDLLKHSWLQAGKEHSPPRDRLPKRPNFTVLRLMHYLGYNPRDTWLSVAKRTFDAAMATYLLLLPRVSDIDQAGPKAQCVAPPPSPADPLVFPLPPKRTASQPHLGAFRPPAKDLPSRGHSLPAIPLSCPLLRPPAPSAAPRPQGWRRVTRIATRIARACCCCLRAPGDSRVAPEGGRPARPRIFSNRVAPESGGQRRPRPFFNRIAPTTPGG